MKKLFFYTIISLVAILVFSGAGCVKKKTNETTPSPAPQETTMRKNGVSVAPKDIPNEAKTSEDQVNAAGNLGVETSAIQKSAEFDITIIPNSKIFEEEKNDKFEEKTYKISEQKEKIFEYYKNEAGNKDWKKTLENDDMLSFEKDENNFDVTILESGNENATYSIKYWK